MHKLFERGSIIVLLFVVLAAVIYGAGELVPSVVVPGAGEVVPDADSGGTGVVSSSKESVSSLSLVDSSIVKIPGTDITYNKDSCNVTALWHNNTDSINHRTGGSVRVNAYTGNDVNSICCCIKDKSGVMLPNGTPATILYYDNDKFSGDDFIKNESASVMDGCVVKRTIFNDTYDDFLEGSSEGEFYFIVKIGTANVCYSGKDKATNQLLYMKASAACSDDTQCISPQKCVKGSCIDLCAGVTCNDAQVCDQNTGSCAYKTCTNDNQCGDITRYKCPACPDSDKVTVNQGETVQTKDNSVALVGVSGSTASVKVNDISGTIAKEETKNIGGASIHVFNLQSIGTKSLTFCVTSSSRTCSECGIVTINDVDYYDCNDDGIPGDGTCLNNNDCTGGNVCQDWNCVSAVCINDNECSDVNEFECVRTDSTSGSCQSCSGTDCTSCTSDSQCAPTERCSAGVCVVNDTKCVSDADCGGGKICRTIVGDCVDPPSCSSDSDCWDTNNFRCKETGVGTNQFECASCSGDDCNSCSGSGPDVIDMCPPDEACVSETCVSPGGCTSDSNCAAGQACNVTTGECVTSGDGTGAGGGGGGAGGGGGRPCPGMICDNGNCNNAIGSVLASTLPGYQDVGDGNCCVLNPVFVSASLGCAEAVFDPVSGSVLTHLTECRNIDDDPDMERIETKCESTYDGSFGNCSAHSALEDGRPFEVLTQLCSVPAVEAKIPWFGSGALLLAFVILILFYIFKLHHKKHRKVLKKKY